MKKLLGRIFSVPLLLVLGVFLAYAAFTFTGAAQMSNMLRVAIILLAPSVINWFLYEGTKMNEYIPLWLVVVLSIAGAIIYMATWMPISFTEMLPSSEIIKDLVHTLPDSVGQCVFIYTLFLIYDIIYVRYMEEKDVKKVYNNESVQSQLDRVLDKLDNVEGEKKAEDKVFAKSADDIVKKPKKSNFRDIGWYVELVKKWVIFLAGLEILVYILALIKSINALMMEVVDPLLLIVDFFVFGYLMWRVKRKERETMWQGVITCFLAGFGLGLIMSIFKVFWIREFWTIFNLITEPVFMGLVASIIGLIIGLFIKRRKI